MSGDSIRAFVVAAGTIGPAGSNVDQLVEAMRTGRRSMRPLSLFEVGGGVQLPVGQVEGLETRSDLPRAHTLARVAAREAMAHTAAPPDAVVLGGTTGGMSLTEELLKSGETADRRFGLHGVGTVAEDIAAMVGCSGPVLTVSTACSSGAVALKVALELIRRGRIRTVLAGGVDSLCRLTYHGFNLLQLIDPRGARPLDRDRRGMSVAEGAAMLLLQGAQRPPAGALAELRGVGLSCDAYHATKPLPSGEGALRAMQRGLEDAGVAATEVDYVNLHGTGTTDNDAAEAAAICTLFGAQMPLLSSTKGITGHPLAAAGAVEALIGTLSIQHSLIPPNAGLEEPDPEIPLRPVREAMDQEVHIVLSNSFGFGGNNASVVLGAPGLSGADAPRPARELEVLGSACITGAGFTEESLRAFSMGRPCAGSLANEVVCRELPPRVTRRLKRLPRLVLAMAQDVQCGAGDQARSDSPRSVFFGTGWGALTETNDFLTRLFESGETLSSPSNFVGSVHNAPAGQVAIRFKATEANVTATGGDSSFEQALLMTSLLATDEDDPVLLLGADEAHPLLSPLFDPSVDAEQAADGGGALLLRAARPGSGVRLSSSFHKGAADARRSTMDLVEALGGAALIDEKFGALLVGLPAASRSRGQQQLELFLEQGWAGGPVVDYRTTLGEYATVSATATVLAVRLCNEGRVPASLAGGDEVSLKGKGILLLSLGDTLGAIEITPPPGEPPAK